jgi:hypothetical protein
MRVRFDLISPINPAFPCFDRGCIVLFAMLLIVPALASSSWSAPSATAFSVQTVDRAHKADRLPLRRDPAVAMHLPEGCESLVSSVDLSPLAKMARTCES